MVPRLTKERGETEGKPRSRRKGLIPIHAQRDTVLPGRAARQAGAT